MSYSRSSTPDFLTDDRRALALLRGRPDREVLRADLRVAVGAGFDLEDLRWNDPDGWHVTLAFLGPIEAALVSGIVERLVSVTEKHEVLSLRTGGGLGAFPSPSRARVAWYGIDGEKGQIAWLAADVAAALDLDAPQRYRPHVTLARARRWPVDVRAWLATAAVPEGVLEVSQLQLMRSHVGRGPTRYETGPNRLGPMTERVLVLPRNAVPDGCDFHGIRNADLAELREAVASHGRYLDRPTAEKDPTHKQLIPYVVVRDGERVFLMHRTDAGGDPRLHGKASIGVGGHLNPVDHGADALMAGLRREWAEELDADWEPEFELIGLLNDESNPVGAVHLGVVFSVEAAGRAVDVRERDKLTGAFVDATEVVARWDRLETWSQLVVAALGLAPGPSNGTPGAVCT